MNDNTTQELLVPIGKDDFLKLLKESGISPTQLPPIFDVDGNRVSLPEPGSDIRTLYSVRDVCEILHVSRDTLRRWKNEGKLRNFKIPGTNKVYYLESDITGITDASHE